jgi:pimeloyl-ACP methyl ester carboxylesterase
MPKLNLGTFEIQYEELGSSGAPIVLVHDSWGDHHQWDAVAARLAETCRVLSYDRRGHGLSSTPGGSVALADQVSDLSMLLSVAGQGARHVVGTGVGAVIALQLALARPELVRSLNVHEPSMIGLLSNDPQGAAVYQAAKALESSVLDRLRAGDPQGAAETFVNGVSVEPGAWAELPPMIQSSFLSNAPASFKEAADPTTQTMEIVRFAGYRAPVVVTAGTRSAPVFATINDRIRDAFYASLQYSFEGAGHFPHVTHPDLSVRVISDFCQYATSQ